MSIKRFPSPHQANQASAEPAVAQPAPLFAGAVTRTANPQITARVQALTHLNLQPNSAARIERLMQQLLELNSTQALAIGQEQAQILSQAIDQAANLMLHPTLIEIRQLLARIIATLEGFAAPFQQKVGWLNRLMGQQQPNATLTQERYLLTRAALNRLLDGLKPLAQQLPRLRQQLTELQQRTERTLLQFDELSAAVLLHLEDHPVQHSPAWEESREAKLSRRLASLRALAESTGLQVKQIGLSIEQLYQLQERLNNVQQVIFPLWQQQCSAMLANQGNSADGLDALLNVQQQFIQVLARSANNTPKSNSSA
ncbi:MAG: hypothetical protein VXW65_15685 [Pseudomonadota bacterium]|nr:hypothetical protein [Pseudomonadota bacterium]